MLMIVKTKIPREVTACAMEVQQKPSVLSAETRQPPDRRCLPPLSSNTQCECDVLIACCQRL